MVVSGAWKPKAWEYSDFEQNMLGSNKGFFSKGTSRFDNLCTMWQGEQSQKRLVIVFGQDVDTEKILADFQIEVNERLRAVRRCIIEYLQKPIDDHTKHSVKKDQYAVEQILASGGKMDDEKDRATLTSSMCLSMTCGFWVFKHWNFKWQTSQIPVVQIVYDYVWHDWHIFHIDNQSKNSCRSTQIAQSGELNIKIN